MKYDRILLIGFRCVGKSYVGKFLAEKINWRFIDMDEEIIKSSGRSINELTNDGRNWFIFRKLELEHLKICLQKKFVVISGGGGLGVNDIIYSKKITFGQIENSILLNHPRTLKVLVSSKRKNIMRRLMKDQKRFAKRRPKLTESNHKQENLINNMQIYEKRKPDYQKIADIIINNDQENMVFLEKVLESLYE